MAITELPSATVIAGLKTETASAAGPPGASTVAAVTARAPAAERASSLAPDLSRQATARERTIRSFIDPPCGWEWLGLLPFAAGSQIRRATGRGRNTPLRARRRPGYEYPHATGQDAPFGALCARAAIHIHSPVPLLDELSGPVKSNRG